MHLSPLGIYPRCTSHTWVYHPFHCWVLKDCSYHPFHCWVLKDCSRPYHPFHCWVLKEHLCPYHPFHCWVLNSLAGLSPVSLLGVEERRMSDTFLRRKAGIISFGQKTLG